MPAARSAAVSDPSPPSAVVGEPVEVRTESVGGVATPAQLLRGGRLWVVRTAELAARGRWRVAAAPGPGVPPVAVELEHRNGCWSLVELQARGGGPVWG